MMSLAVGAVFVVLLVLAGWWPMRRLAAEWAGPSLAERAAVAAALGAAVTGLCQLLASACGLPATTGVPAALALLSLLLCRLAPGRPVTAAPALPLPPLLVVLLVVVALVSVGAAVGTPFSADGVRIWAAKSRDLVLNGASDAPSLHDPDRFGVHRRYPLLLPALLAPAFAWSGPDAAAGPKLVLAALNLAIVGVASALLRRSGPRGLDLLAALATVPILAGLEVRESAVSGGYADSTDALFLLLVVVGLQRLREAERPARQALLAALAGAALLSTKLEGGFELAIAVTAALIVGGRRLWVLGSAAFALLLATPTFVIQSGVVPGDEGFELAMLLDPAVLVARAAPVATGLAGLAIDASSFALLPLLLLAWLLPRVPSSAPAPTAQRAVRALSLWIVAGALGFLVLAYLSTWMVPGRHIYTSAHRLAWHWLPALTWLVAQQAPARSDACEGSGDVAV
jgi:hypothetical protein